MPKALTKCGLCLAAACLTRYDGWFLAVAIAATVVLFSLLSAMCHAKGTLCEFPSSAVVKFVLIAAAAPLALARLQRNRLSQSARVCERALFGEGDRTPDAECRQRGHPGTGNPVLAGMYFLKSAEANLAENEWLQRAWILIAVAGAMAAA